jgi:hypothetical protein
MTDLTHKGSKMPASVIEKYLKNGVLNYIEHETPRHYFLYDNVLEEQPADIHRLVEDLCDENMKMQMQIKDLEQSRDWYRDRVVWGHYEDVVPHYVQGRDGEHEINEPVTAEQVRRLYKALDVYARERDRYRHAKPEITGEYFLAGGYGERDSNMLPRYVEIVPAYGCGWSQVYEKVDRTISYEGS